MGQKQEERDMYNAGIIHTDMNYRKNRGLILVLPIYQYT